MSKPLLVSEIFGPTVQGEGALIGQPTVFVRLGGCDFRCDWCDTLYAVLPEHKSDWKRMSASEVLDDVQNLCPTPILVTLSGGNPAIQDCSELIKMGQAKGYTFCMETQGSVAHPWFKCLDHFTLSPKPPSANVENDWEKVATCIEYASPESTTLKLVVLDQKDFDWALDVGRRFENLPLYLQVCNDSPGDTNFETLRQRYEWLVQQVNDAQAWHVKVLPQLHVIVWGDRRGV